MLQPSIQDCVTESVEVPIGHIPQICDCYGTACNTKQQLQSALMLLQEALYKPDSAGLKLARALLNEVSERLSRHASQLVFSSNEVHWQSVPDVIKMLYNT